ncbi:MAG: alpha/beta fold hydrolase [Polyangia bacterium]|jgi:triacylglycerol esterase/lipase EstA (alpha/beta hydrolase family)|nr:alpha/beta fold hydrolase [Polyangia bacterium]
MAGMAALEPIAWVLGAYLAGTALFLLAVHVWLAVDHRRSLQARPMKAFLSELGWATATEWTVPLVFFLWPWWWRRPRGSVAGGTNDHGALGPDQTPAPGSSLEKESARAPLPVVMVHGWGQNRADFWGLAWRLRRRSRHPLHAFDYWFFGRVEKSARRLERIVDRVISSSGSDRVHLICHSLGGLVARFFVEQAGGAPKVASVTFIGSPLSGTHRASTGIGPAARQMTPGSQFLKALGPPAPPAGVRYHSVWSHSDALVVPPGSAELLGRGKELVLTDAGHLGILYREEVASQVQTWLAEAEKGSPL